MRPLPDRLEKKIKEGSSLLYQFKITSYNKIVSQLKWTR